MLLAGTSSWHLVLGLHVELGVGHTKAVIRAELYEVLPILINIQSKIIKPRVMVNTHFCIEFSKESRTFFPGDDLDDILEVGIEFVLCYIGMQMSTLEYKHWLADRVTGPTDVLRWSTTRCSKSLLPDSECLQQGFPKYKSTYLFVKL